MPSLTRYLFAADPSLAGTARALSYLSTQFSSSKASVTKDPNPSTNPAFRPKSRDSDKPTLPPYSHVPSNLLTYDAGRLAKIDDLLGRYEYNFNRHLKIFLDALDYYAATETVALSRLCAQLSMASKDRGERTSVTS